MHSNTYGMICYLVFETYLLLSSKNVPVIHSCATVQKQITLKWKMHAIVCPKLMHQIEMHFRVYLLFFFFSFVLSVGARWSHCGTKSTRAHQNFPFFRQITTEKCFYLRFGFEHVKAVVLVAHSFFFCSSTHRFPKCWSNDFLTNLHIHKNSKLDVGKNMEFAFLFFVAFSSLFSTMIFVCYFI